MKTNWILTLMIPALIACGKSGFQSTSSEQVHKDLSFLQQMPEEWERIPAPAKSVAKKPAPVPTKPVGPASAPGTQNPVDVPTAPVPQNPVEPPPAPTPSQKPVEPPPSPAPIPVPTPQKPAEPLPVPKEPQKTPPKEKPASPKTTPPKENPTVPPKAPVPPKETPVPPKAPVPPKETPVPPKAPVPPKETSAPPKIPAPSKPPAPPKAQVPPKENPTPPKMPVPPKETPKPLPSPEKPPQKPDEAYPNDFQFRGELTPTVYFHPLLRDEVNNCKSGKWKILRGAKGVELMTVCSTTLQVCAMEGTCQISRNSRTRSFNYRGMSGGQYVFFELLPGDCTYGYGVKSLCLDPFYTVAADLKHHNPGDVIYVPKVAGVVLPNGKKHTGFFIVRDSGGMIKGSHRFDFYSGTLRWNDPSNPFYQIQLSDSNRRFSYSRVTGATAKKVLGERSYPKLPKPDAVKQTFSFDDNEAAILPQIF